MRIMNIAAIAILTIAAIFVLWIGLAIVLSLDSAFHETRKAKPLAIDINAPGDRIILIGHSTVLIQLDGLNIITDPIFSNRILHFSKRYVEPGIPFEKLPKIDVIVISHAHYDHLDKPTLERFSRNIPILISRGNGKILKRWGFNNIKELDPDEGVAIKGVRITAAPAKHSGSRYSPFADFPKALGFIVRGSKTIYFVGDTGMFEGFKKIGDSAKIDAALFPIGAFRPVWFMKRHHAGPSDVLEVMRALKAKTIIPIHWGTFKMALDGAEEPREILEEIIKQQNLESKNRGEQSRTIKILEPGEIFNL